MTLVDLNKPDRHRVESRGDLFKAEVTVADPLTYETSLRAQLTGERPRPSSAAAMSPPTERTRSPVAAAP